MDVPKQGVRYLLTELDPKGLLMQTRCDSEEEARNLLERVTVWTR